MSLINIDTYKRRVTELRPYARGFDSADGYDLRHNDFTTAQKRRITRYFAAYKEHAGPHRYFRRFRSLSRLKAGMKAMRLEGVPDFKGVWLPTVSAPDVETGEIIQAVPKVKFKKDGSMTVVNMGIEQVPLLFEDFGISMMDFALDPEGSIGTLLDATDFKRYQIIAGEYVVGQGPEKHPMYYNKEQVFRRLGEILEKYGEDNPDHYYGNWLFGLIGFNFPKLTDIAPYRRAEIFLRRNKKRFNTKIREHKKHIEKLEKQSYRISHSKKQGDYITRLLYTAIRDDSQATKSLKKKEQLSELKKVVAKSKHKALSSKLKTYLLDKKETQILAHDAQIEKLVMARLKYD